VKTLINQMMLMYTILISTILAYKMKDDNFFTSFDPFNSFVVDYLKHMFMETHQEHETLQLQLMVMSDSHFLTHSLKQIMSSIFHMIFLSTISHMIHTHL
jgi:hypothetical protein